MPPKNRPPMHEALAGVLHEIAHAELPRVMLMLKGMEATGFLQGMINMRSPDFVSDPFLHVFAQ